MSSNAGAGAGSSGREAAIQKAATPSKQTVAQKSGKVTDSAGKAVTNKGLANVYTSKGIQKKAEAEARFLAAKDPEVVRTEAISELEERYENSFGISRLNLGLQLDALKKGAQPVQSFATSGKTITVGAVTKEGSYYGKSDFADAARAQAKTGKPVAVNFQQTQLQQSKAEQKGKDTPKAPVAAPAAPAQEEPETILSQAVGGGKRARGTRFKRFGGAGTILEGTGALYD